MHIMERVDITSKNDQEIAEIIRKKFVKQFSRIYPFSNENLEFLCERRYLEGKIAVTVGSSLDQGFEMLYNGAKEVTVCDVCPSTEDYYELKRAFYLEYKKQAIEKLNDLVCSVEPSMNLYNRVSSLLSKDSRKFFDLFFYLCDEGLLEMDTIFADIGLVTEPRTAYSKSSSFEFLENPNIKFVTDDILTHEFKTPIDYMYLSNIFRFMHYNCWGIESQIRDNLDGKLSEDGKLMLHYQVLGAKPIEILTKDFPGHFSIPCLGMYPSDPEKAYIYSKKAKQ